MKRFYFKVAAAVAVVAFAATSYIVIDDPASASDPLVLEPAAATAPLVEAPVIEAPAPAPGVETAVETEVVAAAPATVASNTETAKAPSVEAKPVETKSAPVAAKSAPAPAAATVASEEVAPEIGTACTLSRDSEGGPVTSEGC